MERASRKVTAGLESVALAATIVVAGSANAAAEQTMTTDRAPPRPISPPAAFQSAVERRTRTGHGAPGENYWQQRVSYRIEATLDVQTGRISGSEIVTYFNYSPDTLQALLLRVEQNVFAPGARRNRRVPVTGGVLLKRVAAGGQPARTAPYRQGSNYYAAATLLLVNLPAPLVPDSTIEIEIDWEYTVPPAPTFRNGNLNSDVFAIAQWYPRLAVYDDVYGWDTSPYLGDGEFYLEYGDYDVSLAVPAGWLIAATGDLANPDRILTEEVLERLQNASRSETVVRVVPPDGRGVGRATLGRDGETLTWRFVARDVRDFAWSTSANYVWDAVRGESGAMIHTLYRPHLTNWRHAWRYCKHALKTLTRDLGRYHYSQITAAEGPVGGMEYPMIVFIGSGRNPRGLAGVLIHEIAHQWFPMVVGSMEAKYAWMDEGFVSYWDELSAAELWQEPSPRWGDNRFYLQVAGSEEEVPLMRHTDLVNPYGARTLAAYTKPAVVLGALREVVGDSVFQSAFRDYFSAWKLKHPQPWDFFNLVEHHAGEDLDWFWRPLFFETDVLDHAVVSVHFDGEKSTITLADHGGVILPVLFRARMADGSLVEQRIAAKRWLLEGRQITVEIEGRVRHLELDAERKLPDINRDNNQWSEGGAGGKD